MELLEQLAAIESSGLVYSVRLQPELEYMFRHAMIQDAAYHSLLKHNRRALHQAVGETLEQLYPERLDELTPLLAQHYAEGGDDARALHYFTRAAEAATQKYANAEAVAFYTHAVEAAERLDRWTADLRHARGHAYELLGEFESALSDYQAALGEARAGGERQAEWRSLMDLGFLWSGRDYAQAGTFLQRAHEVAADLGEPLTLARSLNRLGNWYLNVNMPFKSLRYHEQALGIFQSLADQAGVAETLDLLAMTNFQYGDALQSVTYSRQAEALFRQMGLRQGLSSTLAVRGILASMCLVQAMIPGEFDLAGAARDSEAALNNARDIGWRSGEAFALICLALTLGMQGQYGMALAKAHAGLAIAEAIAHQQWMTAANWTLGVLYSDVFASAQAQRHTGLALELALATGSSLWIANSTGLQASWYMAANDLGQAETTLERWQARERSGVGSPGESAGGLAAFRIVYLARAELALAKGRADQALERCDELIANTPHLERAGTGGVPKLARLRGEVLAALGRYGEAESELQAALAGARRLGARALEWRIQQSLGKLYGAQGRQAEQAQAQAAARALIAALAASLDDEPALRANFVAHAST